jgi:pyrimidine-nucleoside phosphorylase
LESIPGFRTALSLDEYKSAILKTGVVMIGQTDEIAPADRKMYALRDVTSTVESIPLIAGSIMSKKLAEGIDALVLDVKMGRGAFMQSEQSAVELAKTLIAVGKKFGKKTIGFITDMNQPTGYAIGNWLEVVECIECMRGRNIPDLLELTYTLGGAMLMLGGKTKTISEGIDQCEDALKRGAVWQKFKEMVKSQNGDMSFIEKPNIYPQSKFFIEVKSARSGIVNDIDALSLGFVNIMLGGGRTNLDDMIDPKAGIVLKKKVGEVVNVGDILAVCYTDRDDVMKPAKDRISEAFSITAKKTQFSPLIRAIVDENGVKTWSEKNYNKLSKKS